MPEQRYDDDKTNQPETAWFPKFVDATSGDDGEAEVEDDDDDEEPGNDQVNPKTRKHVEPETEIPSLDQTRRPFHHAFETNSDSPPVQDGRRFPKPDIDKTDESRMPTEGRLGVQSQLIYNSRRRRRRQKREILRALEENKSKRRARVGYCYRSGATGVVPLYIFADVLAQP